MNFLFKLLLTILFILSCIAIVNGIESIVKDLQEATHQRSLIYRILGEAVNKK
jgi:hypothetical protein